MTSLRTGSGAVGLALATPGNDAVASARARQGSGRRNAGWSVRR